MGDPSFARPEGALALRAIFGPGHGYRFVDRLPDLGILKKTYRRLSLSLHPDRAKTLGLNEEILEREFREINAAYQFLVPFIKRKTIPFPAPPFRRPPQARNQSGEIFWRSRRIPEVPLRFGQFVYYKGRVSFHTLIRSIVRQAEKRPRVGGLALEQGLLTREEVNIVLRHRRAREAFLEAALRMGFLSAEDGRLILARQRAFRLPIGLFLIEHGVCDPAGLERLLAEFREHNARCRARACQRRA